MKVMRLILGFILLFGFAALMAWGPLPSRVMQNNLRQGIDATALFYTEVDEPSPLDGQ
ncbi:MAG: hypothetical protein AMXMBFR75_30560 [Candidatus Hinthialibacteria bacterium]|nr:hypothetical protein [bacterium]